MTVDYDALALEVAAKMLGRPVVNVVPEEINIVEFASRYRAALAEKMEPVAEFGNIELLWRDAIFPISAPKGTKLYSLEDWKK